MWTPGARKALCRKRQSKEKTHQKPWLRRKRPSSNRHGSRCGPVRLARVDIFGNKMVQPPRASDDERRNCIHILTAEDQPLHWRREAGFIPPGSVSTTYSGEGWILYNVYNMHNKRATPSMATWYAIVILCITKFREDPSQSIALATVIQIVNRKLGYKTFWKRIRRVFVSKKVTSFIVKWYCSNIKEISNNFLSDC